jgi:opacity protein-like surface antigen
MKKAFLATVAALAVFSTAAFAQVEQPQQISVQGTALITKESNTDSASHRATQSGGLLVGYSYQFNNWAGVEGNYGYTRNTENFFGSFGQSSIQANVHEVTGSFIFHIPVRATNIRPYALAGGGALVFDPTANNQSNGLDRQTKGTFVYGGGFNFDVTRNFGVRAEYRGLVYKTPDFTLSSLNLDKVTHLAQPSLGFYFRY